MWEPFLFGSITEILLILSVSYFLSFMSYEAGTEDNWEIFHDDHTREGGSRERVTELHDKTVWLNTCWGMNWGLKYNNYKQQIRILCWHFILSSFLFLFFLLFCDLYRIIWNWIYSLLDNLNHSLKRWYHEAQSWS